jgi:hypothetical protein
MSDEGQGWVLVGLGVGMFALGVIGANAVLIIVGFLLMVVGRFRMPGELFGPD